jgi:hypothetical protein
MKELSAKDPKWREEMDRDKALRAINNGAIAACISGTLTLAIWLVAIFSNASGTIGLWNDPSVFLDVLLIFSCAYGIYKKSRFAAVVLFCYFILAKIYIGIETGRTSGIVMGLVFLYFYGKAVQGTFVFRKIEKAENPNYKPTSKLLYYIGVPLLVIFVVLMGIGLMTMTSILPSTEVQPGNKMIQSDRNLLIANAIITSDDHIEYFYSDGLTSILESGSVLTDDRVIRYFPDENQKIVVYEIYFNDIASVELIEMGNFMNDSIYKINSYESDAWLQLALSTEKRGDIKFIEALREKIMTAGP